MLMQLNVCWLPIATEPYFTLFNSLKEKVMGSESSLIVSPPTVAEMMGVDTESLTEAVSGRGKKLPLLYKENHTPILPTSSLRVSKRDAGSRMNPRELEEAAGFASVSTLINAV